MGNVLYSTHPVTGFKLTDPDPQKPSTSEHYRSDRLEPLTIGSWCRVSVVLVSSQLLNLPHQGPDLVILQLQLMLLPTQLCGLIVQLFIPLGQLLLHCLHSLKTAQ